MPCYDVCIVCWLCPQVRSCSLCVTRRRVWRVSGTSAAWLCLTLTDMATASMAHHHMRTSGCAASRWVAVLITISRETQFARMLVGADWQWAAIPSCFPCTSSSACIMPVDCCHHLAAAFQTFKLFKIPHGFASLPHQLCTFRVCTNGDVTHLLPLQGKMEKSFLTFVATYPTWQPPPACRQVLDAIGSVSAAGAGTAAAPGAGFSYQAAPGYSASPAAGVGACAGLGPGLEAGTDSELWQHQYHSSNGPTVGAVSSPRSCVGAGQQSAAPSGTSSIWVGVAEAPTGLRHPNHQRQQQQRGLYSPYQQLSSPKGSKQPTADHNQQQPLQRQQQQQQQGGALEGMGAGLGGFGSSGARVGAVDSDTARLLDGFHKPSSTAEGNSQQQQQEAGDQYDGFADAMFEPLSPMHGASTGWPRTAQGTAQAGAAALPYQQQQQHVVATASPFGPQRAVQGAQQDQQAAVAASSVPGAQQQQQQQQYQVGRPTWQSRAQQQQQQQQNHQLLLLQLSQYSSSLLPGMAGGMGRAPSGQGSVMQTYPSTLYPGGPSAAAALSHHLQPPLPPGRGAAAAAAATSHRQSQHPGGHHAVTIGAPQQQQQLPQAAASILAASVLQANSLAGSDFLPTNEREDLSSRVAASQSLLQSYYESQVGLQQKPGCPPAALLHMRRLRAGFTQQYRPSL